MGGRSFHSSGLVRRQARNRRPFAGIADSFAGGRLFPVPADFSVYSLANSQGVVYSYDRAIGIGRNESKWGRDAATPDPAVET